MAKIQIPAALKAQLPTTLWGRVLAATPIVMTVVATLLAGLASSEMTKAQYDRSMAAQLQSKAGDQWSYFQAKKLRGSVARNAMELLEATSDARALDAGALPDAPGEVVAALVDGKLPEVPPAQLDARVVAAMKLLEGSHAEGAVTGALADIKPATLDASLAAAQESAGAFDRMVTPITRAVDRMNSRMKQGDKEKFRGFSVMRLGYNAARYDAEAKLNMSVAYVYELQVRMNNISAEKHHRRSAKFFYGMLAAQLAVIVSTFAVAARQRSLLWSIAAGAGAIAVAFAVYVFLYA